MPIWKDPTKDPPREGETYQFECLPSICKGMVIGVFIKADPIHPKKQVHPKFIGWMKSTKGSYIEIWEDERNQVAKYKLLVPHM